MRVLGSTFMIVGHEVLAALIVLAHQHFHHDTGIDQVIKLVIVDKGQKAVRYFSHKIEAFVLKGGAVFIAGLDQREGIANAVSIVSHHCHGCEQE